MHNRKISDDRKISDILKQGGVLKKKMMAYVVAASMVAMFSGNAMAEWVQVGENNRLVAYIDTTIRRTGNTVIFWAMFDYKSLQKSPRSARRYLSERSQQEIDCQSELTRTLFFTWHSDRMGNGNVVYTGRKPTPWEPTSAPESIAKIFWSFVCGKN